MRIHLISDAPPAAWQDFVDRNPNASCMHHAGWYDVLRSAFWVTPYFLMAFDEQGAVQGVLPMYFSRSPLTGPHLSSLEGGVLATKEEAVGLLLSEARMLRDKTRSRYLQIRGGVIDEPPNIAEPAIHTFIDTAKPGEELWTNVKKKTRWAVRQAEQRALKIQHDATLNELGAFYRVYAAHMRDLGTPVFGADVFDAIAVHLGRERLRLYLVRHESRLIGGMICIVNGQYWTDYYAAVRPSADTEFANYLLYWYAIRDAAQSGVRRFDLGRSMPNSNVHLFKRKWRGTDVELPYHYYVRSGIPTNNLAFSRQKRGKGLMQRCWSMLPLSVSNRAGPLIRKQLPFI
jgi:serine/alanine adding enzyme